MTEPETGTGELSRREALRRMGVSAWVGAEALASGFAGLRAPGRRDVPAAAAAAPTPTSPAVHPLGVQLYTVRSELARDLEGTLARVAEIGYREVEFAGTFGNPPRRVRDALASAGLSSPSTHVPLEAVTDDLDATLDAAARIGHRWLVVPWLSEQTRASLEDLRRTGAAFNRAGEGARRAGLRLGYHNQAYDLVPLEGRVPLEVLLEETDPQLVDLELDVYWAADGGGDPRALLDRWGDRVPFLHLKDRTGDGRMVDVGAGAIDWRSLLARRPPGGSRHLFVEHDEPADPFASIRASYAYLNALEV